MRQHRSLVPKFTAAEFAAIEDKHLAYVQQAVANLSTMRQDFAPFNILRMVKAKYPATQVTLRQVRREVHLLWLANEMPGYNFVNQGYVRVSSQPSQPDTNQLSMF